MIIVKRINGGITCKLDGNTKDLMRELGHASAILFEQALKDDMSKKEFDSFWAAWRAAIESGMDALKKEMDDKLMQ